MSRGEPLYLQASFYLVTKSRTFFNGRISDVEYNALQYEKLLELLRKVLLVRDCFLAKIFSFILLQRRLGSPYPVSLNAGIVLIWVRSPIQK